MQSRAAPPDRPPARGQTPGTGLAQPAAADTMILHLTTFLQGGAGRCIADLAIHQTRRGTPVTVVTSATPVAEYGNYPEYLTRLADAGVRVLAYDSLFTRDPDAVRTVADRVRATLASEGIAISLVHAHAAMPALAGLHLARHADRPIPVVQTMHGWGTRKTPEQAAQDLEIMRQVDGLIATSSASRDLLIARGLPADRITVIPCGLCDRVPDAAPPADDNLTADLTAARHRGACVLLCIGSVTENKDQRLLVEALAMIRSHGRGRARANVFAACIGEGALIPDLEQVARERSLADVIRFYGHRRDAARYLALADLLVLPSRQEGQGLAVLEAFRAGVLVIASDTPALAELVTHGQTGFVFPMRDVEALATTIVDALSTATAAQDRMRAAAGAFFNGRFTQTAMLDAHARLYANVIAIRT